MDSKKTQESEEKVKKSKKQLESPKRGRVIERKTFTRRCDRESKPTDNK